MNFRKPDQKPKFLVTVNVPEGLSAYQAHKDVIQLMREEVYDACNFYEDLEIICSQIAKFLNCQYKITNNQDRIHALFIFPNKDGSYER
jgi:hypothetical protein